MRRRFSLRAVTGVVAILALIIAIVVEFDRAERNRREHTRWAAQEAHRAWLREVEARGVRNRPSPGNLQRRQVPRPMEIEHPEFW